MQHPKLRTATIQFALDKMEYFSQWIFDQPVFVDQKHDNNLKRLQEILFKLICGFVNNYKDYKHIMPLTTRVEEILDIFSAKPYQPGNYRTDFVYDTTHQVKLIEITARFALNTQFLLSIFNTLSHRYRLNSKEKLTLPSRKLDLYDYLESIGASNKKIYVLQGKDLRNESKFFIPIFESIGKKVICVDYKNIDSHINEMHNAWVISELALSEIEKISNKTLEKLAEYNIVNDFRTVFLIHDKRFFSVLSNEHFLKQFLTEDERRFVSPYIINTFSFGQENYYWLDAKNNKENWILKHRALGKSQSVYAGAVTDPEEWLELFDKPDIKDFILQEWVEQAQFKGKINETIYNDYVTGTLMFFNDHYFGLGPYRLSSHPVTNIVDDRKAYSVVTDIDRLDLKTIEQSILIR